MAREEDPETMVGFWPAEPKVLIGYALEDGISDNGDPFHRIAVELWVIRLAFQLRQFKTVDLEKML